MNNDNDWYQRFYLHNLSDMFICDKLQLHENILLTSTEQKFTCCIISACRWSWLLFSLTSLLIWLRWDLMEDILVKLAVKESVNWPIFDSRIDSRPSWPMWWCDFSLLSLRELSNNVRFVFMFWKNCFKFCKIFRIKQM